MKIHQFELNKIDRDQFGRVNGILALKKPAGITSHDLVDIVRKKLNTRKVGHTGTLDPFATGLMILLVGSATKLTNQLVAEDKKYRFDILFGVSTDTQDPEGQVLRAVNVTELPEEKIRTAIQEFVGEQEQTAPVYSSIKIDGRRLRELARSCETFDKKDTTVDFHFTDGTTRTVELPKREITIHNIELNTVDSISIEDIPVKNIPVQKPTTKPETFQIANVTAHVSKGTYIRQLAEDVGRALELPAMLISLERTAIGEVSLDDIIDLDDL